MSKHSLYLCYFGLREPLVQTQVLPYLREIKKLTGIKISLLTFEPNFKKNWTEEDIKAEKKKLAEKGIYWYCLPYHKRFSVFATAYDILRGTLFTVRLAKKKKFDIFHSRGHIPAPIAAITKTFCGGKMLFDIRGFMPEEYTDAGVWKEKGLIYQIVKEIEKWLIKKSDAFVLLTENGRNTIFPESVETNLDKFKRPIEVIPCCINPERFKIDEKDLRQKMRKKLSISERFVITHIGSIGGLYLTDEIVKFCTIAKKKYPNTFCLILTQSSPDNIQSLLLKAGFTINDYIIQKVAPSEIPDYLLAADVSLSFVKQSYSSLSRSPTKGAEYLICGLPIISNAGVGDLDNLIERKKVGAVMQTFDEESHLEALEKIEKLLVEPNLLRERCRKVALEEFDIKTVGGKRYRRIYRRLLQN